jgi:hypothetical protein
MAGKTGRPRALTEDKRREALERHALWRDNKPKRIAAELGVSISTLKNYVQRRHKGER